jgi:hypothetical protein
MAKEKNCYGYDSNEQLYFNLPKNSLQKQQLDVMEKNKKLQKKLEEILPESIKDHEGKKKKL